MKHKNELICCIFYFIAACSGDEISPPNQSGDPGVSETTFLNLSYGDNTSQMLDIYLPEGRSASATKVLVFIHGGGWIQGDKSDMREYIPMLQRNHPDHAIVNINYRLAIPAVRAAFPDQFLDLGEALEFLESNAKEYEILPEFGLIGVSSGGHLALQYDYKYDLEDQVKFVCSIVGPTNLKDPYYLSDSRFETAMEYLVDETAYPGITDYAKAVSPAYFVDENSSATILFYGEQDDLVPISNGKFLQEKLKAAGVEHSFTIYSGGHGDWEDKENEDLQLQLKDFIDVHLPTED